MINLDDPPGFGATTNPPIYCVTNPKAPTRPSMQTTAHARRLTAKQERFAALVAQGSPLAAAYREAYETTRMQPRTVWNDASALARHPGVAARIEELRAQIEASAYEDAASLRRLALNTLTTIASDEAVSTKDRIRAAETLGRVCGVDLFEPAV